MQSALIAVAVAALAGAGFAAADTRQSPYAGMQARAIKSLSDEEIAGLREGKGMSLALAAELNGHPGPRHVLDLAEELGLDAAQRARAQEAFDAMQARASALGAEILDLEAKLDAAFQAPGPEASAIETLTGEIGRARGALRAVHLVAHLEMDAILSAEQRGRYAALRGYAEPQAGQQGGHRGHGGHGPGH